MMEFGAMDGYLGSVNAREGNRFAEINANQTAGLFQTINTSPGTNMIWSVSHLARGTGLRPLR